MTEELTWSEAHAEPAELKDRMIHIARLKMLIGMNRKHRREVGCPYNKATLERLLAEVESRG